MHSLRVAGGAHGRLTHGHFQRRDERLHEIELADRADIFAERRTAEEAVDDERRRRSSRWRSRRSPTGCPRAQRPRSSTETARSSATASHLLRSQRGHGRPARQPAAGERARQRERTGHAEDVARHQAAPESTGRASESTAGRRPDSSRRLAGRARPSKMMTAASIASSDCIAGRAMPPAQKSADHRQRASRSNDAPVDVVGPGSIAGWRDRRTLRVWRFVRRASNKHQRRRSKTAAAGTRSSPAPTSARRPPPDRRARTIPPSRGTLQVMRIEHDAAKTSARPRAPCSARRPGADTETAATATSAAGSDRAARPDTRTGARGEEAGVLDEVPIAAAEPQLVAARRVPEPGRRHIQSARPQADASEPRRTVAAAASAAAARPSTVRTGSGRPRSSGNSGQPSQISGGATIIKQQVLQHVDLQQAATRTARSARRAPERSPRARRETPPAGRRASARGSRRCSSRQPRR